MSHILADTRSDVGDGRDARAIRIYRLRSAWEANSAEQRAIAGGAARYRRGSEDRSEVSCHRFERGPVDGYAKVLRFATANRVGSPPRDSRRIADGISETRGPGTSSRRSPIATKHRLKRGSWVAQRPARTDTTHATVKSQNLHPRFKSGRRLQPFTRANVRVS